MVRWMRTFLRVCFLLTFLAPLARSQDPNEERLAREATNQSVEADCLFNFGNPRAALPLYRGERESRANLGDLRYETYAHRAIGCCIAALGEPEEAIFAFETAKGLDLKRDDPGFAEYDDLLIARTRVQLGRDQDTLRSAESALAGLKAVADRDHELEARLLVILTALRIDHPGEAEHQLLSVQSLSEELEIPALRGETAMTLALVDRSH
jgi:tetratricopeptide (TPR) repeat protein